MRHFTDQRLICLLVCLFFGFFSLYLLTYSARIESGDAYRAFDAVSSRVDHGDHYLDLSADQSFPALYGANGRVFSFPEFPLSTIDLEPLHLWVSSILYVIAKVIPNFGLLHVTYLTNILVSAATVCLFYLVARKRGASERASLIGAVMLGVGSLMWVYSKTFFREPLTAFCLLLTVYCIEVWRTSRYQSVGAVIAIALALIALFLSKASALLALPALLILALPHLSHRPSKRVLSLLVGLVIIAVGLFFAIGVFDMLPGSAGRYNILRRLEVLTQNPYFFTALHTYLLSIGGSFWGTSPVLILALIGMVSSLRSKQWRYPLAIMVLILVFAVGYAALNGIHWFGGLSFPSRFLVPILPVVMLGALPILERIANRSRWRNFAILLTLYAVWVQLSGVALDWTYYLRHLPPEAGGVAEWGGGLNVVEYLRWVIVPQIWGQYPLDFAWLSADLYLWALALLACFIIFISLLIAIHRTARTYILRWVVGLVVIVFSGVLIIGLMALSINDERYLANNQTLHDMLPILEEQTNANDVILLSTSQYTSFFLNYGKLFDSGRVITLPLQLGETVNPELPAPVTAVLSDALITPQTAAFINNLAATRERIWLLVNGGPDLGWMTRPVERYLSEHFYPVQVISTGPLTRLIEYRTVRATDTLTAQQATYPSTLMYGDTLRLSGFDLPMGDIYRAGDVIPVTLHWELEQLTDQNYTVALFLRAADGFAITQNDWQPNGGFGYTSVWQLNRAYLDHRGLRLPAELPAGAYQLWVKVYIYTPSGPVDLTVDGETTLEGEIGVLPITLYVE